MSMVPGEDSYSLLLVVLGVLGKHPDGDEMPVFHKLLSALRSTATARVHTRGSLRRHVWVSVVAAGATVRENWAARSSQRSATALSAKAGGRRCVELLQCGHANQKK